MKYMLLAAGLLFSSGLLAQFISKADQKRLQATADTLDLLGNQIMDDTLVVNRIRADSAFTRSLVRALRVPHSFFYRFDSVETLVIQYPPDSSFRLLTWEYMIDEQNFRQKGAIQKHTSDGSLSLIPLFDASEYTGEPNDSIRSNTNWIGAIYYKIIQKQHGGQSFYTLLGYDENGYRSTKKWVDVLTFDEQGQPVFGGDFFRFGPQDSAWQPGWKRFNIEFKKRGRARLMYDEEKDMILFDHLISESHQPERPYTYIPDGDYEGLKWENGKWVHVSNALEGLVLEDGKAPQPEQLMDDQGGINDVKLAEQSEKNAGKKVEAKPIRRKSKTRSKPETD